MLDHLNEIYKKIELQIEDIFCPIALFPEIQGKKYNKLNNNSAINLIARTAYFNNDYDGSIEREITIRDIPYELQKKEIAEYCKTHNHISALDIEAELQIDYNDVCYILEELEKEKIIKIIEWRLFFFIHCCNNTV